MIHLTQEQNYVYRAIFRAEHRTYLNEPSYNALKPDVIRVLGHDIFDHVLITMKPPVHNNAYYYIQTILLYAAYMRFIVKNSKWSSTSFDDSLGELCLKFIKNIFGEKPYASSFNQAFCEHLKQTCILSFQTLLNDENRLTEILNRQYGYLAHKAHMRAIDPYVRYKERPNKKMSRVQLFSNFFSEVANCNAHTLETAFTEILFNQCCLMLQRYELDLHEEDVTRIVRIQVVQSGVMEDRRSSYGNYDVRLGALQLSCIMGCFMTLYSFGTGNTRFPYYLMGTFVFAMLTALYKNKEAAFLASQRIQYRRVLIKLEQEVEQSVQMKSVPSQRESSVKPVELQDKKLAVQEYQFQFAALPAAATVAAIRSKPTVIQDDVAPQKRLPIALKRTEPVCAPEGMTLRCVDKQTNLYLLYDARCDYDSAWVNKALETARLATHQGAAGFVAIVGHLQVFGRKDTIKVYELKNLHKGTAAERLLIPILPLEGAGTQMRVMDCRSALFLKKGLHKRGIQDYCYDPDSKRICFREALSLTASSSSIALGRRS